MLVEAVPFIETAPLFFMLKSVVVVPSLEVELMTKRSLLSEVEAARSEKSAYGDVVPSPKFPVWETNVRLEVPAFPKTTVEDAWRPLERSSVVEVAFTFAPKFMVGVNGNAKMDALVR